MIDPSVGALASRYGLGTHAAGQLARLGEVLATDPAAPTTIREPQRVRDDHLADSLVALELAEVAGARALADLGAGPGLPGLCLAVGLPRATVWLIESNLRKCRFLERVVDDVAIRNAIVVNARIEEWSEGAGRCDLVTARALAPLDVVAEYAAPLLRLGGSLVVWRGRPDPEAEMRGARAAQIVGLEARPPIAVVPHQRAEHRFLQPMIKRAATPKRFPRRPGVARKRPLGKA